MRANTSIFNDANIPVVSVATCVAMSVYYLIFGIDYQNGFTFAHLLYFIYLIYITRVRHGFSDPSVISLLIFFTYFAPPTLSIDTPSDAFGYDLQGTYYVYTISSIAIVLATGIAFALMPPISDETTPGGVRPHFQIEANVCFTLSIILCSLYILRFGITSFGSVSADIDYLERFSASTTSGAGILLLCYPLATAAICFALCSQEKPRFARLAVLCIPFIMLLLAVGQRKFLFLPILFFVVRYFRVNTLMRTIYLYITIMAAYIVFAYLGFIRVANVPLNAVFDDTTLDLFMSDISLYLNAESYFVYSTASSAYYGSLDGSFSHNYVQAFGVLLPQFIFGRYETINDEFSFLVSPDTQKLGGGWGYSFFGEAYLVGHEVGIFAATIVATLALRWLYQLGKGRKFWGLWGVASLAFCYYAMWYLRNSFAIMVREFVPQLLIILMIYGGTSFIQNQLVLRKENPG